MVVAYFDTSGKSTDRTLATGGFLAKPSDWEGFVAEWADVLQSVGVSALHMKDFAHSAGEFKGWRGDESRRVALLESLATVIHRHIRKTIAVSMFVHEYHAFNRVFRLREMLGGPYALTGVFCIQLAHIWRNQHATGEPLSIIFEKGDRGQAQLLALLKHHKLLENAEVTFAPKHWTEGGKRMHCYPFQACDFVAYETAKANRMLLEKEDKGVFDGEIMSRKSFRLIAPKEPEMYFRFIDRILLAVIIKQFGIRKRE